MSALVGPQTIYDTLDSTRNQLDELEKLLKRMLEIPSVEISPLPESAITTSVGERSFQAPLEEALHDSSDQVVDSPSYDEAQSGPPVGQVGFLQDTNESQDLTPSSQVNDVQEAECSSGVENIAEIGVLADRVSTGVDARSESIVESMLKPVSVVEQSVSDSGQSDATIFRSYWLRNAIGIAGLFLWLGSLAWGLSALAGWSW
jgi:hypothetical protein